MTGMRLSGDDAFRQQNEVLRRENVFLSGYVLDFEDEFSIL